MLPVDSVISDCDFIRLLDLIFLFHSVLLRTYSSFVLLLVSINLALLLRKHLRYNILLLLLPVLYAGLSQVSQTPCPVLILPTWLRSEQAVLYQESASRRGAQGSLWP